MYAHSDYGCIYVLSRCSATSSDTSSSSDPIACGQTLTGSIDASPASMSWTYVNDQDQSVTFTNCDSTFDTKMYLLDSEGNYIQSQSTNSCDGDDCYDTGYCSTSLRETFTMSNLDEGTYTLLMMPFSSGGDWSVTVHCPGLSCSWFRLNCCRLVNFKH